MELRRLLEEAVEQILGAMLRADYIALMRVTIAELPRFPQLGALFDGLFRPGEPAVPPDEGSVTEIVDCLMEIISPKGAIT